MEQDFYIGSHLKLYQTLQPGSMIVLFADLPIHKSADAYYPRTIEEIEAIMADKEK